MWLLFGFSKSFRQTERSHHPDKHCPIGNTLHFLIIVRLFPSNSALQEGRRCLVWARTILLPTLWFWRHDTVLWVDAFLRVLPCLCLSIGSVWAPTPTLTCLALAHPCPHSHRGAQHHWAAAEGTCLGMLLKEGRGCFLLSTRLIQKIFICSFKGPGFWPWLALQNVPGGSFIPLCLLTWAAPLSSPPLLLHQTRIPQKLPGIIPCLSTADRCPRHTDRQHGSCLWSVHTHTILFIFYYLL